MQEASGSSTISYQKESSPFGELSFWSECRDSNPRPLGPEPSAIPSFATPRLPSNYRGKQGLCQEEFWYVSVLNPVLLLPCHPPDRRSDHRRYSNCPYRPNRLLWGRTGEYCPVSFCPDIWPQAQKKSAETLRFGTFGTPERTLTSDLPLRRRPLYTTELPGLMQFSLL